MIDEIEQTSREALARIAAAGDLDALRDAELEVLGKRSPLARFKARMGELDPSQRRDVGQALNTAREEVEAAAVSRRDELGAVARTAQLEVERLDLTEFLGRGRRHGHKHLVTQAWERL